MEYNIFSGEILRDLRKDNEMTLEELGELLDVTASAISKYEKNLREPNMSLVLRLARIFKVPVATFYNTKNIFEPEDGENESDEYEQERLAIEKGYLDPRDSKYHKPELQYDSDALAILEKLDQNDELKMLFSKVADLSEDDKEQIADIIRATLNLKDD